MKKTLVILMALIMAMSMIFTVSAETSTALDIADFEDENIGAVYANGTSTLSTSTNAYYCGAASLQVAGRDSEWGGPAWNVTDYVAGKADGQFYCTFAILGTFKGQVRATLHTNYADGTSVYRQIGVLTPFANNEWTVVGNDENGNPAPLRAENWSVEVSEWDPIVKTSDLNFATLYFWVEGDNYADFYLDNVNFWHESDTPVDYTADGVNTTPKTLEFNADTDEPIYTLAPDTEETEEVTTTPVTTAPTTPNNTDKVDTTTPAAPVEGDNSWIWIVVVAAVVVVAVVVVVVLKKKK